MASSTESAQQLLRALQQGNAELVRALDEDSSSIDAVPEEDCGDVGRGSLLIHAAYAGNYKAVETLVLYGADLRVTSSEKVGNVVDWLCWRTDSRVPDVLELVLRKWASYGDDEVLSMLNTPRHLGRTPLMIAVFAPNVGAAEVLLQHSADATYAGTDGSCALDLAAQVGGSRGTQLVRRLLTARADPNVGAIGPLFLAVQEQLGLNSEAAVKDLLAAKARPQGLMRESMTTPTECAARFGFLRVLKLLLSAEGAPRGADLKSALTLAREAGHRDVERVLIKAGAAPDQKRPAEEALDDQLLLPSGFMPGKAEGAASDQIQVDEVEAYRLRFQGSSYMTATAATPVRMCEMHDSFYYEELDLLMAFGYAREPETPLATLPGWLAGTYGLHSDDGLLQANTAETRVLRGWTIKKGSTVGMGVEWSTEAKEYQLFVTLDGQRQPRTVPLADDQTDAFDLYPIVGADRPAVLRVNLGDRPFMYQADRVAHALEKRRAAKLEAAKKPR